MTAASRGDTDSRSSGVLRCGQHNRTKRPDTSPSHAHANAVDGQRNAQQRGQQRRHVGLLYVPAMQVVHGPAGRAAHVAGLPRGRPSHTCAPQHQRRLGLGGVAGSVRALQPCARQRVSTGSLVRRTWPTFSDMPWSDVNT